MYKTKNKFLLLIIVTLLLLSNNFVYNVSASWTLNSNSLNNSNLDNNKLNKKITRIQAFEYIWTYLIPENIPNSYKYIKLDYKDIKSTNKNYDLIQKLVYLDIIPNNNFNLLLDNNINSYVFYDLVEKYTKIQLINEYIIDNLKSRDLVLRDLYFIDNIIKSKTTNYTKDLQNSSSKAFTTPEEYNKFLIMMDVYNTILSSHYYQKDLNKQNLLNWAVKWLSDSIWDPYTTYFPPEDSKDFENSLSWELEWIWIYVEYQNWWILRVISPLDWSPALKAWIKWWDIITKVDWKKIDDTFTSNQATDLIKWKAWTKVKLEIKRWNDIFELEVLREKIVIKDVEYKVLENWVFYIKIRSFWDHVYEELKVAMEELNKTSNITKVVFDLRNNPGWYLDKVSNILSLFIEKSKPVAVIKYIDSTKVNYSLWYNMIDLNKYKLYFLQNSWTASASEIMIWTLKDYFPKSIIVWEKSFWKWSVQTIRNYSDWSSLKYTIAKWYTWLTETWIDHIWIKPDVEIKTEEKSQDDTQLKYILTN